ncbi:Rhs family-like protein [Pseudomonas aeruginosa]|nr:RHS repeat-associated core domain-containing protein [Pseudomonas aeruginosa]MBI7130104.1 Rhs family-like protein [Pseudomonas aeruginosa]MBU5921009.1 Rhs family-like protein [Pseudomonas aeruginosa]MBU5950433.1 Rhs family-like protein [Pseudomonas aeruginosa]
MVGDATAAGWRSANFRVYSGDYNGDGQPDLYLKAVTSVVVVGGEVATPIPLLPPLKNVVLLRNGASYSALYDPPAADLNAVAWTAAPYQSFIGDLNRDGILDLVLQPNDSSDSLLIVSGNPSAHGVLQVASGTGLGTEIGYDVGARFALGDWLGNGGTSIRVSHPTQGQSTLFIDAGGQLVARYLSVPTPLPGVVLGKAAEAFTALNLLAPQAGVRGDGGVDYRYPLELPPGIAGLQPELALVQGGGGGVLGEGWSLAGLSSIERCPASIAQDGQNRQVGLLESDRLCLDGMRLQLLSGEYFKPGSVYRTEIDSFSRVQATGSAASLGFEVRTRDGRILTYDGAAAIKAQGAAVPYQWGISSATDRFGNTIEYRYLAANSLVPSEILYAGNRVSFEYAGALRSVPRYFAGGYTSATHVLTAVAVRGPAAQQLFRTELAYERTQGDASKVRLKQVQRCAWGSAGKECLSPVAFDYLAGVYGYTGTAESAGLDKFDYVLISQASFVTADLNGDGRHALVNATMGKLKAVSYDGGSLVVEPLRRSIRWRAFLHNRRSPELLSRIDAGSGNSLGIEYARLNDPAVHTPQVSAFPQVSLNIPRPVVSRLRVADGIGGTRDYQYLYQGARLDLLGRGFLGFRQMEVRDLARGRTQVRMLRQDFPFVGRLDKEETSLAGKLLARQQNQWKSAATIAGKSFFVYPAQFNEERFDQGAPVSATRRKVVMDESYGNPTQVTEEIAASLTGGTLHSRVVERQYSNDGASWLVGFVTRETESTSGDSDSKSRVQLRSAQPGTLAPASETSFSGSPGAEITRQYSYDGNGRIVRITTSGAGLAARSEQFGAYQGPWPGTRSNALGHVERFAYEAARGQPTSKVDANGLAESYLYDAFGRETLRRFADGSLLATDYLVCGSRAICASGAKVAVRTRTVRGSQQGAAERWQYLDGFGRVLRDRRQAFDGRWINVDNSYDALGRQRSTTEPYIEAATVLQTTWDAQDRPLARQLPSGAQLSYSYGARAAGGSWKQYSLGYDGRSLTERREYDARGKLVLSTNALGSAGEVSVRYRYDADGNLAWTQVAGDSRSEIRMSYDAAGRRTGLFDPNSGQESVQYDALGQALVRTASDGSRTERKYDLLGRVLEQTDRLGGQASISRWQYDTGTKSLGKLVGVAGPGYRQALLYDDLARLKARGWDIEVDGVTRSYQESYGYDGFSRLASTTLANGQVLRHLYNGYGFAAGEQDGAGTTLRQIQARDARDQIVRESYGNGVLSQRDYQPATGWLTRIQASKGGSVLQSLSYRYDGLGNLLERSDARGYSEVLSYDDLNRLLRSARTLDGTQVVQDFTYDALGNLTGKSGVGAYRYGSYSSAEQQLCAGRGGVAQPGPHAVRGTSAGTYCYDARGNQLSGPGRQVKYASFDKPVEISAGSSLSRFSYDPERKRYLQTVEGRTSVYLDEGRFEEVNDGGRSWQDAYVGDYLILRKEGGAVKKLYLLRDALGSVEILLDANGAVSERQSFAAFGEHRGADWKDNGNQPTATSTRRGFTGHEHLEESGLVHMNGRVYDPVIGRFLSADIVYQDTANAQAYNRYSYGWNNPFASVDPTGYALEDISTGGYWYSPIIDDSWLLLGNAWKLNLPESGFDFGLGTFKGFMSAAQATSWLNPLVGGFQHYANNTLSRKISGVGYDDLLAYKSLDQRAGAGLFDIGSLIFSSGFSAVKSFNLAGRVTKVVEVESVYLYRAVGPEEFYSIMDSGKFSLRYEGNEMKQFGMNLNEVLTYANTNFDYSAVVKAVVDKSALKGFEVTHGQIDSFIFKSGVVTVKEGGMELLNRSVRSIHHEF